MTNKNLTSLVGLYVIVLCLQDASALELEVLHSNIEVNLQKDTAQPYDIARDIIAPQYLRGYIAYNQISGSLYLRLASRTRTKVKLQWDNKENIYIDGLNPNSIAFEAPGETKGIRFNVLKETSGTLRIYSIDNILLKSIPYQILKERAYTQTLRFSAYDNNYQTTLNDGNVIILDKNSGSYNVSYSINQKTDTPADSYWSVSSSINVDRENNNNRSLNTSISYTW